MGIRKKRIVTASVFGALSIMAAGQPVSAGAVTPDDPTGPSAIKQAQDASGASPDVPPNWNPDTAPVPGKKAPSAAAVATTKLATNKATGLTSSAQTVAAAAATAASLAANQVAQATTYWCGPAAVLEALGASGVGGTQTGLANKLGTTTDGTAWYTGTTYPVRDVLNSKLGSGWYVPVNVSYSATSAQIAAFKTDLVSDIGYGHALVANAWEVPGGPHLVGHPNITIYHYFEVRGYNSSGANTLYEDSVHGSSTSWASGVPAYSTMSSTTIAKIVGGRGYVW